MFDLWTAIEQVWQKPDVWVPRRSYAQWPGEGGLTVEVDGRKVRYGGCRRRAFYRYNNYKPDGIGDDFGGLFKKECGNFTQGLLRESLMRGKIWVATEVPISLVREGQFGKYRLSGRIDEMFLRPDTNTVEAIEFKTKGAYGAQGVMNPTKAKPLAPDRGEVIQTMPYLTWLGMPNQGIPEPAVNMLYFSREGDKGQHRITFNDQGQIQIENAAGTQVWAPFTMEALWADFDEKARMIVAGEVPERDYEMTWSRETVLWKKDHAELNATDTKKVEGKVKKGDTGQLLDKGDWQCAWCPYQLGCHGQRPDFHPVEDNTVKFARQGEALPGEKMKIQEVHVPETPGS